VTGEPIDLNKILDMECKRRFNNKLCLIYSLLSVTDLEILVVLITRLLRRDLNRLVKEIKPVKLWDEE
jgi:hypothetical protein